MNDRPIVLKILAAPIAFFYWIGVSIRNWMFDAGLLHSQKFEQVTVISIGNITMGGTGKTPFVAWLAEYFLQTNQIPGFISRGYKASNSGKYRQNDEAKELARVKRELRDTQDALEILKKAIGILGN